MLLEHGLVSTLAVRGQPRSGRAYGQGEWVHEAPHHRGYREDRLDGRGAA